MPEPKRTTAECTNPECDSRWWAVRIDTWEKDHDKVCKLCGSQMYLTGRKSEMAGTSWNKGGIWLEHAESNPIYLKNRSEAKKYAKENNVELGCL